MFPGYQGYYRDDYSLVNGDFAILVCNKYKCSVLLPIQLKEIAIVVCFKPSAICSVYRPPARPLNLYSNLKKIFNSHPRIILTGDLNAKNRCWNGFNANNARNILLDMSLRLNVFIKAPNVATFYPRNILSKSSILYLIIAKQFHNFTTAVSTFNWP